ncbi:hypothetical protein [Taylorella asinigenitalis]|uniref:Putative phage protein n=1 Tax=Taylorella asinigenitalis (strain MCE3) TaxID=1008459 RepID=G4QCU7_TAYAM|nr:hypothetical protein [Taylorella asinigenitalis]AEP36227.1 putative phage protein [Taylorella asinigenitalis MCE3]
MAKQFGYLDAHGHFYPDHPALRFTAGLTPGHWDKEQRIFTPTGNPLIKTGNVIFDTNGEAISGLAEDKGANMKPFEGVYIAPKEPIESTDEVEMVEEIEKTEVKSKRSRRKND